ncbi:MAG TPA: ABC transporter permease [Jiangellaceae bacterium]
MNLTYTGLELRRMMRDRKALILTIGMPLGLFLLYDSMWGSDSGATSTLMVMMAVFAVLACTVSAGGRISQERHSGWTRQLRLSALRPGSYVVTKAMVAVVMAMLAASLVFAAGVLMHSSTAVPELAEALATLWAGSIPFALLGILVGYTGSAATAQPLGMMVMLLNAFLGGVFVPIDQMPDAMAAAARWFPSYWLNQLAQAPFGASVDIAQGVLVLGAWTLGLAALVRWRHRVATG